MGGLEACKTKGERAIFSSHHMGGLCAEFGDLPARLGAWSSAPRIPGVMRLLRPCMLTWDMGRP